MNSLRFAMLVSLLVTLWSAGFACADIVWLQNGDTVYGEVVEHGDSELRIRIDEKMKTISLADVVEVRRNIDERRLARLNPDSPKGYFRYAEELAIEKQDPSAVGLAKRLLKLTIGLTFGQNADGERELHISSLVLLKHLEAEDSEGEWIRRRLLVLTGEEKYRRQSDRQNTLDDQERKTLQRIVRSIRKRKSQVAIDLIQDPKHRDLIEKISDMITFDELKVLARSSEIDDVSMHRLLAVELRTYPFKNRQNDANAIKKADSSWVLQSQQQGDNGPSPWFIEGLGGSGIDVRATLFRQGRWVRPNVERSGDD